MKKTPVIRSGFRTMFRYKLRTLFMMLGVVVGITTLTVLFSLSKGTTEKMMQRFEKSFGSSKVIIAAGSGQARGVGHSLLGPTTTFTLEDMAALEAEISNIDMWDAQQSVPGRDVKYKENSASPCIPLSDERVINPNDAAVALKGMQGLAAGV